MTLPTVDPVRSPKLVWIAAVLTSFLGAAILFSAEPGINWPIWVAAASASLIASRLVAARRAEIPLLVLVAWATLLSVAFALTDTDFLHFLIVLSDAMLLGLATITLGAENWSELSAKLLVAVPFLAPLRVLAGTAHEGSNASRSISSPRSRAIVKGTLFSVPLVLILIVLLSSADPIIRWSTDRIAAWLPDWSFPPRVIFFVFLLVLTLGANSIAARQIAARFPQYPPLAVKPTIGLTEQRMMLWSAAVVLWLFVALQASYFIHPPPAAIGTGVTFADFARRGFGELSFAATIVVLSEQAYGFTEARVFAQAYMFAMALALAALGLEIMRRRVSVAFGRRVAEIALGVFTILVFWNYESWIANRNVDRARLTGKFDASYATRLSRDAIPTLVRRRGEIPQPQRDTVEMRLACKTLPADRRWFEWNRSTVATAKALSSYDRPPCPIIRPTYRAD